MKIDYKVTTIILIAILIVTYAISWDNIFYKNEVKIENKTSKNTMMHEMPDGSMMMNDYESMMDMTMTDMVGMLEGKTGKELEKEFILGMIPHHQGAVDMAKKLLADEAVSQELKNFANQIISAQESEIKMMNAWLKNY